MRGLRRRSRGGACVALLGSEAPGCDPAGWPGSVEVTTVFFSSISPFLHQSGDGTVHHLQDLAAYILERGSVDVDAVEAVSELGEVELFFQPNRKIVRVELQPEPGFDEMVMNAVHTNPVQAVGKFSEIARDERRWNNDRVGCAKVKRFQGGTLTGARVGRQVALHDVDEAFTQGGQRRELAHINGRQALGQAHFVTGCERPVGEVVGEAFSNEMVLLESAEGVLKYRRLRAGAQSFQEFREVGGFLPLKPQQMSSRVEVERRSRPAFCGRR